MFSTFTKPDEIHSTCGMTSEAAKVWEAIVTRHEQKQTNRRKTHTQEQQIGNKIDMLLSTKMQIYYIQA